MWNAMLRVLVLCAATAIGLLPVPAWAHGDVQRSSPADGDRLRRPPESVTVQLAEPPAQGSDLIVIDGCRERVSGRAQIVASSNLVVPIAEGRPGRWQVRVRSLSSVDGHLVRESFSFLVRGNRDCSADETPAEPGDSPTDAVELVDPPPPLQNEESSFPIVPFALGTVVVVALAVVLRRSGTKR